jgi:hypothetical protein
MTQIQIETIVREQATQPTHATAMSVLVRAKAEFLEMPGLQLTVAQAARLWHLDRTLSAAVLEALVETGFLVRTERASFARSSM